MTHPRLLRPALAFGLFASLVPALRAQSSATYEVRFEATWSAQTHPGAYPGGAHFSPLIGATHDAGLHLWEPGGSASQGIEVMAETGGVGALSAEVNAAIAAGSASQVVQGPGISSPGATTASFGVTDAFSRVSLVTMIAPSPDWFLGVDGVELRPNGHWVNSISVPLFAWDAGTDSGADFNSPNADTNPQEPIALITSGPFFGNDQLGTFTFTRQVTTASYCTGKTNSQGCVPRIGFSGSPSLSSASPFLIDASRLVSNKLGILFYGTGGPASTPFQNGTICVQAPILRTAVQQTGGNPPPDDCSGTFSFDFNAYLQSGADPSLQQGTIVGAQYWARDPAIADGTGSSLSDALEFQIDA